MANTHFSGPIVVRQAGATPSDHLKLEVRDNAGDYGGKTLRINFNNNNGTANSLIGFQVKPPQNASTAQNVIGGEISPRLNSGVALTSSGTIIGLHVDTYLKGTAAGTIGGDVRGMQIELITDDAGTRNITGDVTGLRIRMAFSAGTVTGKKQAIKIEVPETQTNSENYDAVLTLTSNNGLIWKDDYGTEPTTAAGAIKVLVNGNARWIQLYSGAPVE